jgi:CHASE1-domain containing sensor protein
MISTTEREKLERAGTLHWFHWVVILLSLLLTFFAWYFSKNQLDEKRSIQFEREADQVIELVLERMHKYEDALWGGVALIRTLGGEVDYDEWLQYSNSIQIEVKYPGINGIGVIHALRAGEVPAYLEIQRKQRPNFNIHPGHQGREYYPITYIQQFGKNPCSD